MKLSDDQFVNASLRLIAAGVVALALTAGSGGVFAADRAAHEQRAELRIEYIHARLNITAAQEAQWTQVSRAIRDNARIMYPIQARMGQAQTLAAVSGVAPDRIASFTPAFADLYASLSEAQKRQAASLFRHSDRQR